MASADGSALVDRIEYSLEYIACHDMGVAREEHGVLRPQSGNM